MRQEWFEFGDVHPLQRRPWIPLRQSTEVEEAPEVPGVFRTLNYCGRSTAAIATEHRALAEQLDWSDLDLGNDRPEIREDRYLPADTLLARNWQDVIGVKLVVDQYVEHEGEHIWHLHHDLVIALGLVREDDTWFRPEEGWAEVARLSRDNDGKPVLLEIRSEFLGDYLSARRMGLYVSSYFERRATVSALPSFTWLPDGYERENGRDRLEGRAYVDDFAPEGERQIVSGALWRTEWFEPLGLSTRTRGDADPVTTTFAPDATGVRMTPAQLRGAITYLHFRPELVSALASYRGHAMGWYSRDTGSIGATRSGIHFGVNDLGRITIFGKDINRLDAWEQRIWSAFNVAPEGGVSTELWAAQMQVNPAATEAPEWVLGATLNNFNAALADHLGAHPLRDHESIPQLLRRAHRFRGIDQDGILALAKDLARLFMERIEVDLVCGHLTFAQGEKKPGSLKALERLLTLSIPEADARAMMAPLFGIYDLRLADAHLGGEAKITSGLERAGVDVSGPTVIQARQMLDGFVSALRALTAQFQKD